VTPPRLVIAAPASGHGKTTVACGLMAALRARGLTVSGHKTGPDYIDPGYHALATGRPARNLDPVLCGEDLIGPLFAHGAAGADIAVVEGVMGAFDGRGASGFGSTAHVARLLAAPMVLVVDCRAQGRSVAALVAGFAGFETGTRLGGVILNRVGSARHEEILRESLAASGCEVLGAIGRHDEIAVPSRHLGLIPAAERDRAARETLDRLAALVAGSVDLAAVVALARTAGPLPGIPWEPGAAIAALAGRGTAGQTGVPPSAGTGDGREPDGHEPDGHEPDGHEPDRGGPVVAVADGAAFSFRYTETTELLTAAGAEVATFDPLRDEALPDGTAGLVLGGGFPEAHAAQLSMNQPLRDAVARLAAAGAPVVAECAGLLYLSRDLDGHPMCGVLPASAAMTPRLALGYRDAVAASDSVLGPAGTPARAHEFHRTSVTPGHAASPAWRVGDRAEGFVTGGVHASYLHTHWAGHPAMAARLTRCAARWRPAATVTA